MSDHQNKSEEKPYEIELLWEIGAFLPECREALAEKKISEKLDPSMFETIDSTKLYWSVPERLLDIRILMLFRDSLIGPQSHNTEDNENPNKDADLIPDLRRIQFYLYRIVRRFAEWCFTLGEADGQLKVHQDKVSLPVPPKIKQLISAYLRYVRYYGLKDSHGLQPNDNYTWKILETTHSILKDLVESVCEKVNGFFNNLKNKYGTKEPLEDTKKAEEYSIEKLLGDIEIIARKLGINNPTIDAICNYQDDSSRCVALLMFLPENQSGNQNLQPENQHEKQKYHQYLAFSGYLDCEETEQLPDVFRPKPKLASEFEQISGEYGAKLVTLKTDIIKRISTYVIAKDFTLIKSQTLLEAVDEAKENAKNQNVNLEDEIIAKRWYKPIKKDYSCCERKILAADDLSNETSKNTMLLVKFQPCFDCYAALKKWKEKNNIKLSVDYIPRSTLIRSGKILSEPNESPINPSANDD